MTQHERDPLEALFQSLPDLKAPDGFSVALLARLEQPAPLPARADAYRLSGMVCLASAAAMMLWLHTPLNALVPQILSAIGGFFP